VGVAIGTVAELAPLQAPLFLKLERVACAGLLTAGDPDIHAHAGEDSLGLMTNLLAS
jgi:hypothetical protein